MKPYGYPTDTGYKGFMPSLRKYLLFDTEEEYVEYFYEMETEESAWRNELN